jgi:hypothetical protein
MKSYAPKPRREDLPVPLRDAALAFLDVSQHGMLEAELAAWCRRHLLARGFLRLRDPMRGRFSIVEPGAGDLEMTTLESIAGGARDELASKITKLAHRRVVDVLSLLLESPPDDRFLHAAIQSSRVARVRAPGEKAARWRPALTEGDSLSYMVVTLFAADALDAREDYDTHLRICRTCGALGFDATTIGRFACPLHASGGPISKPAHSTKDAAAEPTSSRSAVKSSGVRRHPATSATEPALRIDTKKASEEP